MSSAPLFGTLTRTGRRISAVPAQEVVIQSCKLGADTEHGDARAQAGLGFLFHKGSGATQELVDNLNASSTSALLTDIFLIDEALKHGKD